MAWVGRPLKHFKVYIKIVKQHTPKRLDERRGVPVFCCFSIKKFIKQRRGGGSLREGARAFGVYTPQHIHLDMDMRDQTSEE